MVKEVIVHDHIYTLLDEDTGTYSRGIDLADLDQEHLPDDNCWYKEWKSNLGRPSKERIMRRDKYLNDLRNKTNDLLKLIDNFE